MDACHIEILRALHKELRDSLSADADLLADLYSKGILSSDEVDNISMTDAGIQRRPQQRVDAVLALLPSRGKTAFHVFCDALYDSKLLCNRELSVSLKSAETELLRTASVTALQDGGNTPSVAPVLSSVHPVQPSDRMQRCAAAPPDSSGPAGGPVNPWEHPEFAPMYAWLIKYLYPSDARNSCFKHNVITWSALSELQTKERISQTAHNEFLLQQVAVGGRESFRKFADVLEDMGPNYEMKRRELVQLEGRL